MSPLITRCGQGSAFGDEHESDQATRQTASWSTSEPYSARPCSLAWSGLLDDVFEEMVVGDEEGAPVVGAEGGQRAADLLDGPAGCR